VLIATHLFTNLLIPHFDFFILLFYDLAIFLSKIIMLIEYEFNDNFS